MDVSTHHNPQVLVFKLWSLKQTSPNTRSSSPIDQLKSTGLLALEHVDALENNEQILGVDTTGRFEASNFDQMCNLHHFLRNLDAMFSKA